MRIRKPKKDRQRNSQKKTDKRTNSEPHSKLKIDPNKTWRVSSSCSTSDARRATLVPYSCAPNRVKLCAEKESIYAPLDNMEFHRQLQKYHVYEELNISISMTTTEIPCVSRTKYLYLHFGHHKIHWQGGNRKTKSMWGRQCKENGSILFPAENQKYTNNVRTTCA
jgi:hypothetical protein